MVHSISIPEISFEQAAKLAKNINFDYFDATGKELIETAKKHGKSVAGKFLAQGLDVVDDLADKALGAVVGGTAATQQWWLVPLEIVGTELLDLARKQFDNFFGDEDDTTKFDENYVLGDWVAIEVAPTSQRRLMGGEFLSEVEEIETGHHTHGKKEIHVGVAIGSMDSDGYQTVFDAQTGATISVPVNEIRKYDADAAQKLDAKPNLRQLREQVTAKYGTTPLDKVQLDAKTATQPGEKVTMNGEEWVIIETHMDGLTIQNEEGKRTTVPFESVDSAINTYEHKPLPHSNYTFDHSQGVAAGDFLWKENQHNEYDLVCVMGVYGDGTYKVASPLTKEIEDRIPGEVLYEPTREVTETLKREPQLRKFSGDCADHNVFFVAHANFEYSPQFRLMLTATNTDGKVERQLIRAVTKGRVFHSDRNYFSIENQHTANKSKQLDLERDEEERVYGHSRQRLRGGAGSDISGPALEASLERDFAEKEAKTNYTPLILAGCAVGAGFIFLR